ncbi:hypothetical protein EVA_15163 [gut metagenome]|uniref:Uncharacterized protein n=1 Tax=gut metagenome TaxID=749906 RepID=J9GBC6_9ZZZZ
MGTNPFCSSNKVQPIAVVFLHTRCNCEDVRVKDDVCRRNVCFFC